MARVLIVAYNYPPLNNGGVQRTIKLEKYLSAFDVQPVILTHRFHSPEISVENGHIRVHDTARRGDEGRLRPTIRTVRKLARLSGKYFSSYDPWRTKALNGAKEILEASRPDLILATFPPAAALEVGLALAQAGRLPFVADFRDGLCFEPLDPGRRYRSVRRHHQELEDEVTWRAAAIVTVSEPISDYFRSRLECKRVITVTNGFDPDDFDSLPAAAGIDQERLNLVFTGRLSLSDPGCDARPFFAALKELLAENPSWIGKILLHMVGEFSRDELEMMRPFIRAEILRVVPLTAKKDSLAYQKGADLLLLITSPHRRSVITGKLFEYLYSGQPILALTHNTAAAEIIGQTGSGWIVPPRDQPAIKNLLGRLISDRAILASLNPDHRLIESYSVRHQVEKLAQLIHQVLSPVRE